MIDYDDMDILCAKGIRLTNQQEDPDTELVKDRSYCII